MKILFAIDSLHRGGKERQFIELVKGINASCDFEIQLIVFSQDTQFNEVYDLGIKVNIVPRQTLNNLAVFPWVFKIVRDFRPDLVHSWHPMVSFYLLFYKPIFRFKFIEGSIRSAPPTRLIPKSELIIVRISALFAVRIVSNTAAGLESYKIKKKKLVIHNGFDLNRSRIEPGSKELFGDIQQSFKVGMVGNFTEYKDYDTFFAAAVEISQKHPGIVFIAVGEGPTFGSFITKYQNHKNFIFTGAQNQVEPYINSFDICILCSTGVGEGISNSILEYMAFKKPVIALDCPGNREVIEEEVSGLFYRLRDPLSLASQIERLIAEPKLREKLGEAGYQTLKTRFSFDTMIEKYGLLFKEVTRK